MTRDCPACDASVEFTEWCDDFPCPHCAVVLRHQHDCWSPDETFDAYCDDWLVRADAEA